MGSGVPGSGGVELDGDMRNSRIRSDLKSFTEAELLSPTDPKGFHIITIEPHSSPNARNLTPDSVSSRKRCSNLTRLDQIPCLEPPEGLRLSMKPQPNLTEGDKRVASSIGKNNIVIIKGEMHTTEKFELDKGGQLNYAIVQDYEPVEVDEPI
ncbi:hypothetical protein CROQUDRAFT_95029 [Cronartium quercuum f. sp. fusiforme G11]|uniref:Uncharacterized protein n=1 Tax=Cronartium quercuum f. sp. fusiforme G11 TaxID=708437 RepID=A0A9P6NCZ0_9BASI|nr:hypothetical protein CROQUDRAFT_95029 [Cronartium quercuum f. sp. fusiforme G11]